MVRYWYIWKNKFPNFAIVIELSDLGEKKLHFICPRVYIPESR